MRYLIFCLCFCLSFTACSSQYHTPSKPNKEFDAYMPPTFQSFFEDYIPIETETPHLADGVWDVSDVDISYVNPSRKLIAFTFDDAPAKTLENIFAVFTSYNEQNPDCKATATFFFNSIRFDRQSVHYLHTANILGFELGNHTHSHLDLTTLSKQQLMAEINQTDAALAQIDGKERHLLRAPFGNTNEYVKTHAPAPLINWTIDTLDWTGADEERIYQSIFDNRFSGAIVLMHDGYPATVKALKRLLPDLKKDGYQVLSVSAMAKAHGCVFHVGKEYIRARKQKQG